MSTVRFAAVSLLLLAASSVCSIAQNSTCKAPPPRAPKVFVVGDDKNWSFGYNYADWAFTNAPFYPDDTLEFRYPRPSKEMHYKQSVYLMKDFRTFQNCILNESKIIADVNAGDVSGGGFKFKLDKQLSGFPTYYFASGERKGLNCDVGTMKFMVKPVIKH